MKIFPEWYSDIFGVYLFAGTFLAGLAATTLAVRYLSRRGRLEGVRFDHVYNLGGLIFAFTVFWSYIAFAQYMLQWYSNMPEEVFWFVKRTVTWQLLNARLNREAAMRFWEAFENGVVVALGVTGPDLQRGRGIARDRGSLRP